jgi:lipopolysaccharide/colanic/teichoic acid biosynthesis glycosyltransferase
MRSSGDPIKRCVDFTIGLVLLILTVPVQLIVAALVWVSLGRPLIFAQPRLGRGLELFTVYKFRTMRDPIDSHGCLLSIEERVTPLCALLRRLRLDELPQLLNVVRGDMALIGPRPLVPEELVDHQSNAQQRALVRPGITGWAQVSGGQLLDVHTKLALDLWYIRNASALLDLKIVVLTLSMVVRGERINWRAIARAQAEL